MRAIFWIFGILLVLFAALLFSPLSETPPTGATAPGSFRSVPADKYDRVRVGMRYAQVIQILGAGPGLEVSRKRVNTIPGVSMPGELVIYQWEMPGRGIVLLSFHDGELIAKMP